jgi:hypothetical protein
MTTKEAVRRLFDTWKPRAGSSELIVSATTELTTAALGGAGFGTPHTIFEDCQKAIRSALDCEVRKVSIDTPGAQFATIAYSVDYAAGLASRLRERHWPRLDRRLQDAFGNDRDAFRDMAWTVIGQNVRPSVRFWDDPFAPPPRATIGDGLCTAVFYFAASVATGDMDGAERLANLIRLLPYAVPVGERPAGSGEWLVALRPATK